jgi:predicted AAA+ superfamily ATPase
MATARLLAWKEASDRHPLLVRGARQVGKTWAVVDFGTTHFPGRVHVIDFEQRPAAREPFAGDLDPRRILSGLELLLGTPVAPGRDLLLLDEIQACPRALMALRYFYEQMPELHVIAAGSLVEFALGQASFPVGRIDYLTMRPMTFVEYLWAIGNDVMADTVAAGPGALPSATHRLILEELRRFFFVGGMPAAVRAYADGMSLQAAFTRLDALARSYRDDFGKYAARMDTRCLDDVLVSAARGVGRPIKYSHLAPERRSDEIHRAFELLTRAGVLRRIPTASPAGLPLGASASHRRFKALLVDVGLMQRLTGMPADVEFARSSLLAMYAGALAEQFVGQELVASLGEEVYCWMRPQKSSSAEVDYLVSSGGRAAPIEVKSGPAGRLRSLHLLLAEHPQCAPGLVLSEAPFAELPEQDLTFVPLYYAGTLFGPQKFSA